MALKADRRDRFLRSTEAPASITDWTRQYYEACSADLTDLSSLMSLVLGASAVGPFYNVTVDHTTMTLNARASHLAGNEFVVAVGLGAFATIDDFSRVLASVLLGRPAGVPCQEQFFDYGSLVSDPEFRRRYCAALDGDPEWRRLRLVIANASLLWVYLHEIGHALLGHCRELADRNRGEAGGEMDEVAIVKRDGQDQHRRAAELQADLFATLSLIMLTFRTPILREIFPARFLENGSTALLTLQLITSICPLLFERARRLTEGPAVTRADSHPGPLSRLYNVWIGIEASHEAIFERFDGFERFPAHDAVFAWAVAIPYIDSLARFLDADLFSGVLLRMAGSDPDEGHPYAHAADYAGYLRETKNIVLSLWHWRYMLNFLSPVEPMHAVIAEWRTAFSHLLDDAGARYQRYRPEIGACLARAILGVQDELLAVMTKGRDAGLLDTGCVQQILRDSLIIADGFARLAPEPVRPGAPTRAERSEADADEA